MTAKYLLVIGLLVTGFSAKAEDNIASLAKQLLKKIERVHYETGTDAKILTKIEADFGAEVTAFCSLGINQMKAWRAADKDTRGKRPSTVINTLLQVDSDHRETIRNLAIGCLERLDVKYSSTIFRAISAHMRPRNKTEHMQEVGTDKYERTIAADALVSLFPQSETALKEIVTNIRFFYCGSPRTVGMGCYDKEEIAYLMNSARRLYRNMDFFDPAQNSKQYDVAVEIAVMLRDVPENQFDKVSYDEFQNHFAKALEL